jgi:hypothetical protein
VTLLNEASNTSKFPAKFRTGLAANLPSAPDGPGDAYFATDTQHLYVSNLAGDTWSFNYDLSGLANANVRAKVTKSAVQSITANTWTAVSFNQEEYDTNAMHDTVTNNDRLTCQTGLAGVYRVTFNARWGASFNASHRARISYYPAATVIAEQSSWEPSGGGANPACCLTVDITLAVAEYVIAEVRQESAGAVNLSNSNTSFSIQKIG